MELVLTRQERILLMAIRLFVVVGCNAVIIPLALANPDQWWVLLGSSGLLSVTAFTPTSMLRY